MSIFSIDPDIRRAKTLDSSFYTDPGYFELSKERIFSRAWHLIGRTDDLEPLHPVTLLPGVLDEPVLMVRSGETTTCVSNVCTHRGNILVGEPCKADLIRCGYHGRRFSLDGKFLSMPEFDDVECFPSKSDDLRQFPVGQCGGFLFMSIDPIEGFDVFFGEAAAAMTAGDDAGLRLTATRQYEVNAHWALYCENYLEGFHIPFVHHGLNEVVDYGSYTTENYQYSSVQTGFDKAGAVAAKYIYVFPNMMFNLYPWGISVNVVRPVSPSKSVVEFLTYVRDGSQLEAGAGADLHTVELEDERIVENVQRGIRSRFYSSGRYSPTREQGTHHFHRLIAEFMG